MKGYFIAGIHTGIGKTLCSAVLVQAWKADYWKPVQAGGLEYTDSDFVREHAPDGATIHPESYRLQLPASPHFAAEQEGLLITLDSIQLPETDNLILVESAGGILSPIAPKLTQADLAAHLGLPVILVSMNYLGSINHTLLSVEAIRSRNIPIAGIIFNGPVVPSSESFVLDMTGLRQLGRIEQSTHVNPDFVFAQAKTFAPV